MPNFAFVIPLGLFVVRFFLSLGLIVGTKWGRAGLADAVDRETSETAAGVGGENEDQTEVVVPGMASALWPRGGAGCEGGVNWPAGTGTHRALAPQLEEKLRG